MIKKLLNEIADEKMKELGFEKIADDGFYVEYERNDDGYTQIVDILHRKNGKSLVLSYDPESSDDKGVGDTCAGLSYEEMCALCLKMKAKGWA